MSRPFDHAEPFDVMADQFRRQTAGIASAAYKTTIYRELTPVQQLESFIFGVTVGLIGVCFASIRPEGRDEMIRAIVDYLPQAREQVEGIMLDGGIDENSGTNP